MSTAPENTPTDGAKRFSTGKSVLMLAALGVVFGDIGTSPLYALRECFAGSHAIPVSTANILGAVSLIFWFLVIIVSVKYIIFVMRADNKGEGGILALMALIHRIGPEKIRNNPVIPFLAILGAALLFSDGAITPAISVLSAVEGLNVATPMFSAMVIPFSVAVLIVLFVIQSRGSAKIGALFGPVMLVWFFTIGLLGAWSLCRCPGVLEALNPVYAVKLLAVAGWKGFALLGTAFLAVTGAEVLYADIGHFGKSPIRKAWFLLVFPALILNYMGQGAYLLRGGNPVNLFYQLSPSWFVYPLVIIATLATIIASQAVISGAFSLARQSVQLGFWPRIRIIHTSKRIIGQVYIPFINTALFIVTMILILGFRKSGNLASAYGIAVSATMLITTALLLLLARTLWHAPLFITIPVGAFFLLLHTALFVANLLKVFSGGWVVILLAAMVCILMTTWVTGRRILQRRVITDAIPLDTFVKSIAAQVDIVRAKRTAVFLVGNADTVPRALLHNFKHNGVLHAQSLIVTVVTEETPYVPPAERLSLTGVGEGIYKVAFRYGFMESPDIPKALAAVEIPGAPRDSQQLSYFLGKESLVVSREKTMMQWRKQIFLFMTRNSLSASSFFNLPPNRVIELGVQIEF
jgi:KUP system potassium uptake protein